MAESKGWLKTAFTAAVVALAIDLLLVFPVSHTSIIGAAITKASGSVVVPPLDWFATNVLGMKSAAGSLAAPNLGLSAATFPPPITGTEGAALSGGAAAPTVAAPTPAGVPPVSQPLPPPIDQGGSLEDVLRSSFNPADGAKGAFFDSSLHAANDAHFQDYALAA